jgi:hypothetical protein
MRVSDFANFIKERERVRIVKEAGKPKPWTDDPILQTFRFCNVRREDDAVTRWIAKHWRNRAAKDLWFAMVVARLFNNPDALEAIGFPIPWRSERTRMRLHDRRAAGLKNFNAAYIVSTNGLKMDKVDYVIDIILDQLWEARRLFRPEPKEPLYKYHRKLEQARGLGSFMAAQVVADMKYAEPLNKAPDWFTFAAPGPGSKRGLNRVRGMDPNTPWGSSWLNILLELRDATLPLLPKDLRNLHAQDIQNCLCEFDKYERIRTGEGRPKQLYSGKGDE